MELSGIVNLVLGGGLMATVAAVITLRSTVRKAKAEAEKAMAEAETVRIDNTEKATRVLIENIVNPLKEELNETRKDLNATKREMARLRKAIDDAGGCRYSDNCPVLQRMRYAAKDDDAGGTGAGRREHHDGRGTLRTGQRKRGECDKDRSGEGADVESDADDTDGQSPAPACGRELYG